MKKIQSVLFSLVLFISILSCSTQKSIFTDTTDVQYGASMKNTFERVYSNAQFDSICVADKISNKLDTKWHIMGCQDADNGQKFNEYLYIKELGATEIVYRAIRVNADSIKVTKRVVK